MFTENHFRVLPISALVNACESMQNGAIPKEYEIKGMLVKAKPLVQIAGTVKNVVVNTYFSEAIVEQNGYQICVRFGKFRELSEGCRIGASAIFIGVSDHFISL
jgi:hypothetical protein